MSVGTNNVGQPVFYTAAGTGDNISHTLSGNLSNPNYNRLTRLSYNPYTVYGQIANNSLGLFNGNIQTRENYQAGNVGGRVYYNITGNAKPNSYNLARGLNYDMIGVRNYLGYNPRAVRRDWYPNGVPYPAATHYRGVIPPYGSSYNYAYPYASPYGSPYGLIYGSSYGLPYESPYLPAYPSTSPECARQGSCRSLDYPNDCRSCVSQLGGSSHCATQICGPHV